MQWELLHVTWNMPPWWSSFSKSGTAMSGNIYSFPPLYKTMFVFRFFYKYLQIHEHIWSCTIISVIKNENYTSGSTGMKYSPKSSGSRCTFDDSVWHIWLFLSLSVLALLSSVKDKLSYTVLFSNPRDS